MTFPHINVPCLLDDGTPRPGYVHDTDAGMDLTAAEPVTIPAGLWQMVPTGLRVALPDGYAGLVTPRSGLAFERGVTVLNAPGLIDAGYRGEIGVILHNAGRARWRVEVGDRVAQLVVIPVVHAELFAVRPDDFPASARAEGGFGSTGR